MTVGLIVVSAAGPVAAPALAEPPARPAAEKKPDKPAAGSPGDDKPAKTTVSDADAQRFYAFIEKLIAIVVANQDDCVKMAAGVNAHVDANRALIKEAADLKAQNKALPPAIKDKLSHKFKEELEPAIKKKCSNDPAVREAFLKIKT
ncbi:MAG TPA: hypothetical protein VFT22_26890 [Kofleriaceae bacterium]|nr:hypothetical protein [Kofleriaceae bacterium]